MISSDPAPTPNSTYTVIKGEVFDREVSKTDTAYLSTIQC
jgi:hypothetical protein